MKQNTQRILIEISADIEKIKTLIEDSEIEQAKALCDELLADYPNHPDVLQIYAIVLHKKGDTAGAITIMQKSLQIMPRDEIAHFNIAVFFEKQQRYQEAMAHYEHIIRVENPKNDKAMFNLAELFHRQKHLKEAEHYYRTLLGFSPYHPTANGNLGAVLIDQGRFDDALPFCEKAVMLALDNVNAQNNCGIVYSQRGQFEKAEKAFNRALKIKPDYEPAKRNLALLQEQKNNPAARPPASKLTELVNLGNAQLASRELEQAIQTYREVIMLHPDIPEVLINLGMALTMQRRFSDAEGVLRRAISISPQNADAYGNLGTLYKDQNKHQEAIKEYRQALAIRPEFFEALVNMAMVLEQAGKHEESIEAFKKALSISPEKMLEMNSQHSAALSQIISEKQRLCLWDGLDEYVARLIALTEDTKADLSEGYQGFLVSTLQTCPSTPQQQKRHAEKCSALNFGAISTPYDIKRPLPMSSRKGEKLRIGYLSCDFHQHATAYLMAGLFEEHDRSRFEIYAYSYGIDDKSAIAKRIREGVDRFIDISEMPDKKASEQIARGGIDILVELKGYTKDHRLGIAAFRPAPIQVHYLGYPGTIGAPFIDYFLADKVVAPPSLQPSFSEKLVWLPGSYQINDYKRAMSPNVPTRAQCGLPEKGFVFCSFNQNYKITPQLFDMWMRLLKAVPESVLWVYISCDPAIDNLRHEASARGVDPSRLVFATYKPLAEHLARCQHADLFLDTLPVNAHTTASDALWAGVPVLTCMGEAFTSRVAASLLSAMNLPELITHNLQEYEALALNLAQDPQKLAAIKRKLADNKKSSPLFDTKTTTRAIEKAYQEMIERHNKSEMPESFEVTV